MFFSSSNYLYVCRWRCVIVCACVGGGADRNYSSTQKKCFRNDILGTNYVLYAMVAITGYSRSLVSLASRNLEATRGGPSGETL